MILSTIIDMVLTRELNIKITESNISYYENLGYDIISGDVISIPIELLQSGSHLKILCECDVCSVQKDVIYKNYLNYNNKWGEYKCRKCSEHKRIDTLQINHGVDYPSQNKEILEKMKKSYMYRYKK